MSLSILLQNVAISGKLAAGQIFRFSCIVIQYILFQHVNDSSFALKFEYAFQLEYGFFVT